MEKKRRKNYKRKVEIEIKSKVATEPFGLKFRLKL